MKKWMSIATVMLVFTSMLYSQTPELSERRLMTPTKWAWLTGASSDQIKKKISEGFRIIDLEVEKASPLRFSAVFVKNSGKHKKTWSWHFGLKGDEISQKISSKKGRIIDLERYKTGGDVRYAMVMVSNSGNNRKGWWYYTKLRFAELKSKIAEKDGRLYDWDTYTVGNTRYYSAEMVPNKGGESKSWWYYSNLTPDELKSKLKTHNARLTDIEVNSYSGGKIRFSGIMEQKAGETWWWRYGKTKDEVNRIASQAGARIIDIEPYFISGGKKRFAVLLIRNTNDHTENLRKYMSSLRTGGAYGFYVKRVNGKVVTQLQADRKFYPASSIKVLEHVHAMCLIQAKKANMSTRVTVYKKKKESCADKHTGHSPTRLSMEEALETMMQDSDNRSTNALQEFFGNGNAEVGRRALNNTAHQVLGMSRRTQLNHKFECGGPTNDEPNTMTLRDLGKLYEKTSTGLFTASIEDDFDELMKNLSFLNRVINEEAAKLGISSSDLQSFKSKVESRQKVGSVNPSMGRYRSQGGWISLPTKSGSPREYVFGFFIDKAEQIDSDYQPSRVSVELLRSSISSALKTYK